MITFERDFSNDEFSVNFHVAPGIIFKTKIRFDVCESICIGTSLSYKLKKKRYGWPIFKYILVFAAHFEKYYWMKPRIYEPKQLDIFNREPDYELVY